jgi:SAM-dependent methyltransferase
MLLDDGVVDRLACIACRAPLRKSDPETLRCTSKGCQTSFPVRSGIPDLLPEAIESDFETDYEEYPRARAWSIREFHIERFFHQLRRLVEAHAETLGRRVDFVDIGSGLLLRGTGGHGGRFFRILRDFGRSYTGIEPSWRMLKAIDAPEGNVNFLPSPLLVRSTGELLPVRSGSFDIALNLSVLDHCSDASAVVARSLEALRPGGLALLHLQNDRAWYREVVRTLAPRYYRRRVAGDNHHHRFTPSEAGTLFRDRGFQSPSWEELGYLSAPGLVWLATAALYPTRALGLGRGAALFSRFDRVASRLLPGMGLTFLLHARAPR